jgi:hypothetical protein
MNLRLLKRNIKNILLEEANVNKPIALTKELEEINKEIEKYISYFKPVCLKEIKICLKIVQSDYKKYKIYFCAIIKNKHGDVEEFPLFKGQKIIDVLELDRFLKICTKNINLEDFKKEKNELFNLFNSEIEIPYGYISFGTRNSREKKCYNSFTIYEAGYTLKGWGPLLYDLALEYSTMFSNGLTPDRNVVSPTAYNVWKNYFENRPDVAKSQLDIDNEQDYIYGKDKLPQLTPEDESDDCRMASAIIYFNSADLHKWPQSPLSKMYKKDPNIINKLKSVNLLFEKL